MSEEQFAIQLAHLQAIQGCLLVLVADVMRRFIEDIIEAFTGNDSRKVEIWNGH